jgi:chitin disaccharide deacetylase
MITRRNFLQATGALLAAGPRIMAETEHSSMLQRLGYGPESRLLILHADDLAVAHSENRASWDALESKAISSMSVMVPCPWLTEVAQYFKQHPDIDLGLHLTLCSEWVPYRWGPVASRDQVRSLIDPDGYLWGYNFLFAQHARPEEVEIELRAQVERAMELGIRPTHLDAHMSTAYLQPPFFAAYLKVARQYGLPFRTPQPRLRGMMSPDDLVVEPLPAQFTPPCPPGVPAPGPPGRICESGNSHDIKARLINVLRELKPGVYEMPLHLAYDDAEFRAITADHPPPNAPWRQFQFDLVTSPEFRKALSERQITLTNWTELRKRLRS